MVRCISCVWGLPFKCDTHHPSPPLSTLRVSSSAYTCALSNVRTLYFYVAFDLSIPPSPPYFLEGLGFCAIDLSCLKSILVCCSPDLRAPHCVCVCVRRWWRRRRRKLWWQWWRKLWRRWWRGRLLRLSEGSDTRVPLSHLTQHTSGLDFFAALVIIRCTIAAYGLP